jgi:hypothetical protein
MRSTGGIRVAFSALMISLVNCGESKGPTVAITFSAANPAELTAAFSAPSVDLVLEFQSLATGGKTLDQNNDGQPDLFRYPAACASSSPSVAAGCGYPVSSKGNVEVGDLVMDFQYQVGAFVRNATGGILYSGTATFLDDGKTTTLTIPLIAN